MNCQGQRTLYLRANGDMPCEDDTGEQVVLARIRAGVPFDLKSVLASGRYQHLSESMRLGRMPWPLVCERCAFLRSAEPHDSGIQNKRLEKLQVETTLACALSCPGCNGRTHITSTPGPHVLPLASFERLMLQLRDYGYLLDWVEYCGQGEPLNHKNFPAFISTSRAISPATRQRVITNGNHDFDGKFPHELPDEIFVSCDGAYQDSYAKYRIGGSVDKVLSFMRAATRRIQAEASGCVLIWKYILFEHNDSDEEIEHAQTLAEEIGVHRILFVATHSAGASARYNFSNLDELPLKSSIAEANSTPILYRSNLPRPTPPPLGTKPNAPFLHLVVDECRRTSADAIFIRGWSVGDQGRRIERIDVVGDGRVLGTLAVGQQRPDVVESLPQWDLSPPGFSGHVALASVTALDSCELRISVGRHQYLRKIPI